MHPTAGIAAPLDERFVEELSRDEHVLSRGEANTTHGSSPMWRLLRGGALALLTACGEAPDPMTPEELCDFSGTAAYGTGHVELGPVRARIGATRAGAWSTSSNFGALTVIDAFTVDGEGRPLGELFILYNDAPRPDTVPLVPATLAELHSIPPEGSFAFIAEGYDPVVGDYDRWLVSGGGC